MASDSKPEHLFDLEVYIGPKQGASFPIKMTLDGERVYTGQLSADILSWTPTNNPDVDGEKLFDLLFQSTNLQIGWAIAREQSAQRRVRLHIDPHPEAAKLHSLPWELLQKEYETLAAQANTPFSRYLPNELPWGDPTAERPIRLLVVISDPKDLRAKFDLEPVDVTLERENLERAFVKLKPNRFHVDFLEPPTTPTRLEKRLRQGYHALHFVGHGALSTKQKRFALYMQDDTENSLRLSDKELVRLLARQKVLPRLVSLVACQGAARSSVDALIGLAPQLVDMGVPAVVAMQDLVSIETARLFSATFYQRLLEHGLVDLAANEARSELLTVGREDAAVPVLFMRLQDGQLFQTKAPATPPQDEPQEQRAFSLDQVLDDYVRNGAPSDLDHRRHLYTILSSEYNAEEIRNLCFDLGLEYDDLTGSGRSGKARELITYLERRREIDQLIKAIYQQRPNAPWDLPT